MNRLEQLIKQIPKGYFTLNDLKKISRLNDPSLKVAINRLLKTGRLTRLTQGFYTADPARVDYLKLAQEFYYPCYLSFEWALHWHRILSQKPYALTLATAKRSKELEIGRQTIVYHHLQDQLIFGFANDSGVIIADPEKAFLDLAYLSLNGYGRFDPTEMNLHQLNHEKLKRYLKLAKNDRLAKLTKEVIKNL